MSVVRSEGVANGEMECCVASPSGMYDWPMLLIACGIVGFQAEVESEQEVGEVHAQSDAIACGYLSPEGVEMEHSSGLIFVVMYCPDVSGVGKQCAFKHPEKPAAILEIEKQADVATLVNEIYH